MPTTAPIRFFQEVTDDICARLERLAVTAKRWPIEDRRRLAARLRALALLLQQEGLPENN